MRDLDDLAAYIAADSEQASAAVEARILTEAALLSRFPRAGRRGCVPATRERIVGRTPYILVYQITQRGIRILRVYHGARRWPERIDSR